MSQQSSEEPRFVLEYDGKVYMTVAVREVDRERDGEALRQMLDQGQPVANAVGISSGANAMLAGFSGFTAAHNDAPVQPASFDGLSAAHNDAPVQPASFNGVTAAHNEPPVT